MDLGELVLRLDADVSQLERRLNQVESDANNAGRRSGSNFGDSFVQGIGQAIGSRATDLVFGAFRTVPDFVKDSLRVYQEFSQSITQAGVFSNATETQLKSLSDESKRLGAATSKSAVDVAKASVELIKMGFSADEAKNALNGVVAAAESASEEVDISGEVIQVALANFSNQFTKSQGDINKLAKELAVVLEGATKDSLDAVTGLAKDLFEYLAKNPSVIKDTIKAVDLLARSLAKVVEVAAKYVSLIGSVVGLFGAAAAPGQEFGFTDKEFKQRFDVLGSGLVDQNRNSKLGVSGNEQLVQDTLEQLIGEQRDFGQPLKITKDQVDQRALENGDRLPILERPFANRDDLRKQAYEQLRKEQGKILLAQAKQKEFKPKDKPEEPKPKDKPVTPKSSPQKVEQAVEDVEAKTKAALDAIARAELERQLAIEKLVVSGAITHNQAEVQKLESTRLRIQQEIKLEQDKLTKGKFKKDETPDQVKLGITSKTIDLLKIQQQIEVTTRDQILSKLQKQTQLEQQKLGLANQAIAIERLKVNVYDEQLNRLKLIESSVERQQRLKTAENNLQSSILNADIERSNLRLDDLNQARDIFKQLQGDISESQRNTLTAELGRLGLQGRIDEKSILTAINEEERAQFRLKADALKQQQEIEKQNLGFEREKTQLQIQQNNLSAERQVKEAEFNLAQSKVDNQSRALDSQAKLKEAEIKAKGIKNKEEKKEALELVELYRQQLGLIQQQSGLVEANGQSAISIAKQNQESIAQEAVVSNKELEIKQKQLEVNQKLERDKLDSDYNKGLSRQRIGISELNDNKNSSNQTANGFVSSSSISKVNNGIVTLTDGRTLTKEESQALLSSNTSIAVSSKTKVNSVNVSPIPKDSLFGQSNPIPSTNRLTPLSLDDGKNPFFTGSNDSGKFFDKLLTSPLQNPISKPLPLPNAKALDSNVFQDKVLQQMGAIIDLLKDNTPIIQNNDYTLQANNEIEILQKARNQSINDLIGIFKNVQGVHRG